MVYAIAGAMVGAILIRIFVLLKQRADRATEREQIAARLQSVL